MSTPDLYNLSPALLMMIMGLVIACGPLAWVALRNRNTSVARRLQVLTLVTLFLTFDLIIFGAFTRLTDSGLGCPDWPGCYGSASPVGAQLHIAAAQSAMPTGPVTHTKAWIEMIHRYLATGVGVLILTLTLVSWRERKRAHISPWWPTLTLLWVFEAAAFAAAAPAEEALVVDFSDEEHQGRALGFCTAAAESSSWDTEEAPIKAEVIPGWRSTQAIAS